MGQWFRDKKEDGFSSAEAPFCEGSRGHLHKKS